MFNGRFNHTLDEKGRLAIPARFKDIPSLKENPCLVVTNHLDCLWAFTKDGWHGIQDRIAKMSLMNEQLRSLRLFFISGAKECPIKQGRITLPPELREVAGLQKDVMLVGGITYFEIWDKSRWDEAFNRAREDFRASGQVFADLGI